MPDVSMCTKASCPKSKECFRYRAEPNPIWQSYAELVTVCNEEDEYHYFIHIRPGDILHKEELSVANRLKAFIRKDKK